MSYSDQQILAFQKQVNEHAKANDKLVVNPKVLFEVSQRLIEGKTPEQILVDICCCYPGQLRETTDKVATKARSATKTGLATIGSKLSGWSERL